MIVRKAILAWIDNAVFIDNTLNRKGKSFGGYEEGTFPTYSFLVLSHAESNSPVCVIVEGPDGCVPIQSSAYEELS